MAFDAIKNLFGTNKPKPENKSVDPKPYDEPLVKTNSDYVKNLTWKPLNLPKEEPDSTDTSPLVGWETLGPIPPPDPAAIKGSDYAKSLTWKPLNLPKPEDEPGSPGWTPLAGWKTWGESDQDSKIQPETLTNFDEVLALIPATMPECFKAQAKDAIRYIQELDQGTPSPEALKFASQLALSSFAVNNTIGPDSNANPNMLPPWLIQKVEETQISYTNPEEAKEIKSAFNASLDPNKMPSYQSKEGIGTTYFQGNGQPYEPPHACKNYLEGKNLYRALDLQVFQKIQAELLRGPNSLINLLKLFDGDRLVLYFTKPSDCLEFSQQHPEFKFRGLSQDLADIKVDRDDPTKLYWDTWSYSNDSALWDKNRFATDHSRNETYTPVGFAKRYLALCAFAGKNPVDCQTNSFIYFSTALAPRQLTPTEIATIEQETGLPVYVTDSRTNLYEPDASYT